MHKLLLLAAFVGAALVVYSRSSSDTLEAGTAVQLDVEEMFDAASWVVEGRVRAARVLETADGRIETEYELLAERTFWGGPGGLRTFRLPGGVLPSGRGLLLPGLPRVEAGEDVLLFLSDEGRRGLRMPVGLAQGAFRLGLDQDGRRIAVRHGTRYGVLDPVTGRLRCVDHPELFSYADLSARLQAAANARRARGERER